MISEHGIPHHFYADDGQLYVSFVSGDSASALSDLQSCVFSVQSWMSMNKLKMKPDKSEFLLIENKRQQSNYIAMFPIELFGVKTKPAKSARNLGVIFDTKFHLPLTQAAGCQWWLPSGNCCSQADPKCIALHSL